VATHLKPEGVFLLTVFVPDINRLIAGQELRVTSLERNQTHLDASQFDPISQQVTSNHIVLTEAGTRIYPVRLRYAWPSELDLMARLAGLTLKERWSNWKVQPSTPAAPAIFRCIPIHKVDVMEAEEQLAAQEFLASFEGKQRKWEYAQSSDHQIRIYKDTAVMVAMWSAKGINQGQRFDYQARSLAIYIKRDGRWQLAADQSTPIKR
jgi:hypothetical protein